MEDELSLRLAQPLWFILATILRSTARGASTQTDRRRGINTDPHLPAFLSSLILLLLLERLFTSVCNCTQQQFILYFSFLFYTLKKKRKVHPCRHNDFR